MTEKLEIKPSAEQLPATRAARPRAERAAIPSEKSDPIAEANVERLQEKVRASRPDRTEPTASDRQKAAEAYHEQYLPDYLKGRQGKPAPFSRALGWFLSLKEKFGRTKVTGRENIPENGPFLVVSNHSGGETGTLLGLFADHPLRIAAAEQLNWKRSSWRPWLLKKLGMLSVSESLRYLNAEEKEKLVELVPGDARKEGYQTIIDNERDGKIPVNRKFVHEAVAALLGKPPAVVAVFPEGLFLYQGRALRRAYGGLELILREYKRVTGNDLPIVPVAISGKKVGVGQVVIASQERTGASQTDRIMTEIAKLLPESERGYYAEAAKE